MAERKITSIRIGYDDGTVDHANGDAAAQIWDWLLAGEGMALAHGAEYHGPKLETAKAEE